MYTKRYLALVMALVMVFSLVVPVSANVGVTVPTQEATLDCGTETHATSKLTVYVAEQGSSTGSVAAVGTIFSDMSATLQLNYGNYTIDNANITIYGQTHNKANLTTFTLDGHSSTEIVYGTENGAKNYFPGFDQLTKSDGYAIKFVDELGTSSQNWYYTFKKSVDTSGVTLELVVNENETTVTEADARWQALKAEAFTNTDQTSDDSYIKLAAGSYIQLDTEKLTVNGELKLDNFSDSDHVDANVTNAKAKLTYTTPSTTAYQLLLKKGTQFVLGHSIAEVKQDLLVTMTNVTKGYEGNILKDVYDNLATNTEQALAENLLKVFSEIAGLARPTNAGPVVITFGTPTTSTNSTTTTPTGTGSETVEKTTTTIVTNNAAGTTDTTTVSTETETVVDGPTTTVTSKVTETSSTVAEVEPENEGELKYTVTNSETTTTTTFVNGVQTGNVTTSIPATVKTVTVSTVQEDSNKDLSEKDEIANVATPALDSVAEEALAAIVTKAITDAQTGDSVNSISVEIVVEAVAKTNDNGTKKTYEVTPKAYTYVNTATTHTSVVVITNAELATDAQFSVTLPVPDAMVNAGKLINVTHRSDNGSETFQAPVLGSAGAYYVTFTVTHFSEFDLEPVTVAETGTAKVAANLTLEDDIAINFHVYDLSLSDSYYSVHYSFNGEDEKVVPLSSITPVDGKYSITVANCAAKQMADVVNFKLYCGDTAIFSTEYSIRDYCINKIKYSDNATLVNLCHAVLNYGANAQSYFSYNTSNPANEGYATDIPESVPTEYNNLFLNAPSGINLSANMTLLSKTELNFILDKLDTTNLGELVVMDLNASTTEPIEDSRVRVDTEAHSCIVTVEGIPAKHLNHVFELSYQYGSDTITIQFSPMTYAYRNQSKTTKGLGNLCRALYGYWQAADAYLPNN